MASYNELNALIDAYINRNGVQAITGQILNGVLKAMVEQLGRGYTIMGAATPATDPGTPDGPECWFASAPGTYTDFDGLQIVPGELALLCYTPTDGWTKATIYEGFQTVQATIDGNVGTPSVGVSYADGVLSFDFHNMKGNPGQNGQDGDPAGFGTIGADITGGVGTPGVTVDSSGPATAKNLQFHFTNLKGETGVTSVVATVDNTTGNPACTVSLVGQQLTLAFSGLKGAQGDTGSSVDYPFTIVNNLTTNDATQALSAAMGVQLESEIGQLEAEVDELQSAVSVSEPTGEDEDVLFETNAGNFAGKIDGEGGHFKNLFIQDNEAGTGRTDVTQELATLSQGLSDAEEELTKLDSVEVSSTENDNQEIVFSDSDNNEVAKVNEDGITAKDVFVGGIPLSAFSFVGMTAIFDNLGFIGDSLSSGYLAAPDVGGESPAVPIGDGNKGRNIYRMSWGQILARMYGAKATNFSLGGLTAKGWLDTYPGKTSENGYNSDGTFAVTFNSQPKGFYTICLGTNDSADEITNPVGDVTTDIDTEDYHNNADTFAGNYAKIIQLCRELTPSCKIFVITPFSWWSYGAESKGYNDVVRAMPGIFDKVYLIDLYTDYYGHTPQYVYGGHGTTMGYVFTATAIAKAIDSIVRANEDDFKFQSIVTRARQDEGQY